MGLADWINKIIRGNQTKQLGSGENKNYGVINLDYNKLAKKFEIMSENEIVGIRFDQHGQVIVSLEDKEGKIQSLAVARADSAIVSDVEEKNKLANAIREQVCTVLRFKDVKEEEIENGYKNLLKTWENRITIFEEGTSLLQEAKTEIEKQVKIKEELQNQIKTEEITVEYEKILEGKYLIGAVEQEDGKMGVGMFWQNGNLEIEHMQIATCPQDKVRGVAVSMGAYFNDYRKDCQYNRDKMDEAYSANIKYAMKRGEGVKITSEFLNAFSMPCQNSQKTVKRENRVRIPEEMLEEVKGRMRAKYEKQNSKRTIYKRIARKCGGGS